MPSEGKVSRRLTVRIAPLRGGKYSVSVIDSTTRSLEGKRRTESDVTADTWLTVGSASEAFEHLLKGFAKSVASEDPGALFSDEKGSKPKLDL